MRIIPFNEEYDQIWDKIYEKFSFQPSIYSWVTAFDLDMPHRVYRLPEYVWDEEQEALVERLMAAAIHEEIYALDWQHPAYTYVPGEEHHMEWYDNALKTNMYFPTYYPNGDYYFFVAKDLSFGWLGHPWQNKLILFGNKMLHLLDGYESRLGLTVEE